MVLLRVMALVSLLLPAMAAAAQTGTVTGHVFCADTQTPCRFANVVLQSAPAVKNGSVVSGSGGGSGGSFSGQTDLEGAFQISGVQPGDYYILGRLPGYVSAYDLAVSEFPDDLALKAQALEAGLSRISVELNQTTVANLTLARGASLSGTARFDDGGAAGGLAVHLFRRNAAGKWLPYLNGAGASRMSPLGFASRTDDRGHFYEPGLAPGTYTFAVTLPEVRLVPMGIGGHQSLNVRASNGDALEIFNGNTYRVREASAIELRAGESRDGEEITIPTHGLHTLRGYVSAGTDGQRGLRGNIRLLDPEDRTMLRETTIQGDGSFAFNYVATGSYLVEINAQASGRGSSSTATRYTPLSTTLAVEGDITSLAYTVLPEKQ